MMSEFKVTFILTSYLDRDNTESELRKQLQKSALGKNTLRTLKVEHTEISPEWECPECGSTDIEESKWINVNTGEVSIGDGPLDTYFCNSCDNHFKHLKDITPTIA